ncbi:MAG: phosphatidylserine decarboxylase family protein [Bacteroidetes bacterium]|nr:phosphatidylserine decarboxylase family protein [Bacteroidota bacterium]MBU1717831.1 phosphatidylserine decarboxylase family protein [Bacteroidota bacterium]
MIHREGYRTLFFVLSISLLASLAAIFVFSIYVGFPLVVFLFIILVLVLWFFRIPKRSYLVDNDKVISPADGKVVVIEEVMEDVFFHEKMIQISVFMSPLNVHINRYPVAGRVVFTKYFPGKFLVAWHPKSSSLNEQMVTGIDASGRHFLVKQIAGAVARRVVCYAHENDDAKQCSEMGFIKFGSRVDVLVPLGTDIIVKIGDKVKGGISTLAKI